MTEENTNATENNKTLAKKEKTPILAGTRGVQFSNLEDMYRFCTAVVNSRQFKDIDTPEVALVRLQAGMELGLSPIWSLTNILVVNGRPSVWGDALLGLVLARADCEDVIEIFEEAGEQLTAVCEVRRKGRIPVIRKYSVSDAKRAGLWDKPGPWKNYPKRMLQMRARAFACRDAYADVLRGLSVVEELREVAEREPVKATEKPAIVLPDEIQEVPA
jgi:hypothetical protein